jgi:hypothetical protein
MTAMFGLQASIRVTLPSESRYLYTSASKIIPSKSIPPATKTFRTKPPLEFQFAELLDSTPVIKFKPMQGLS